MNIKALITTLILGSSSAAMAKPVVTFSGSASVSVGSDSTVRDHRSARPIVRDHRDLDCHDPIVAPAPVKYQPVRPLPPRELWFAPTNTEIGGSGSLYIGSFGRSTVSPHHRYLRAPSWFQLTEATRIDSGREFFKLKGQGGYFTKLHLKNLGGRTDIAQVGIEYKVNGRVFTQKVVFGGLLTSAGLTINLDHDSRTITRIVVYGESGRGSAYQMLAL